MSLWQWLQWGPKCPVLVSQVGITLHYSSLSTLLWMGVKARVLHKELTWRAPPPQEGDSAPPAPRPMLRYMLLALGSVHGGEGISALGGTGVSEGDLKALGHISAFQKEPDGGDTPWGTRRGSMARSCSR